MKNFQTYFYEANKIYEFRIKIANHDVSGPMLEAIKNAVDAFQLETIGKPQSMPIQEHKEFGRLGPCECYTIDIAVRYPTITEQIRQLIINRAGLNADCVCVYTKDQYDHLNEVQERIDSQNEGGTIIGKDDLPSEPGAQELVGQGRASSLLKELESRKYEFAQDSNESGKTTNTEPTGNKSPVGSQQNKVYKGR